MRKFLESLAAALHDDDFEAVVVIEVDVGGGENHSAGGVLGIGQLLREIRSAVIVDQRQGADDRLVRVDVVGKKRLADEIADGLGAVFVAASCDQAVKFFEEIFVERNAGPAEWGHGSSPKRNCTNFP